MSGEKSRRLNPFPSLIRLVPMLALSACLGTGGLGASGLKSKKTTKSSLVSSTDAPLENIVLKDVVPVGSFIPYDEGTGTGLVIDVATALKKQVLGGKDPASELLGDNLNNTGYMSSVIEVQIPSFRIKASIPLSQFVYTDTNGNSIFKNTLIIFPKIPNFTANGLAKIVQINNIATRAPIIFLNDNRDLVIVGGEKNGQASPFIHRITTLSNVVDPLPALLQAPAVTPNVVRFTDRAQANWLMRYPNTGTSVSGTANFIVVENLNQATLRAYFVVNTDGTAQTPFFCLNYVDSQVVTTANPNSCNYLGTGQTVTPGALIQQELNANGYRAGATTGTGVTFQMEDTGITVETL